MPDDRPESIPPFLHDLLTTASPSGFEQTIQKVVRKFAEPWADEISVDVHGNLIAAINPQGSPRILLMGHCDEIALQITLVDDKGYARFTNIGGINRLVTVGQRVTVQGENGPVAGVIGQRPVHTMTNEDREKVPKMHELIIDIGAADKDEALQHIAVGDTAVFRLDPVGLLGQRFASRGVDNRIGVWTVFEAGRQLAANKDFDAAVFCVSSVQEEVGLRGARTSTYGIDPHIGIAVDVGFAADYPGEEANKVGDVKLGKGPILHRGANINPVLDRLMVQVCKDHDIPFQMVAEPGGTGTDANAIQLNRAGVAAAIAGVPLRYMHTTVETMDMRDGENVARLLAETVRAIKKDTDFTPA